MIKQKSDFYKKLTTLAIPILIQSLVMSSLNLIDNLMIGQLGEISIAAVGLGNQIYFLANLFMLGISGGASIFFAQFWGKRDLDSIHKTMGLGLILTLFIGILFAFTASVFPSFVMGIYSKDPAVIAQGSRYLKIAALSYIPYAITTVFVTALRSTEEVKVPLFASIIALGINTILNYMLIFGNFGMPKLGVQGAAIATLIARTVEVIILLTIVYSRKFAVSAKLKELFDFSFKFAIRLLKKMSLVMANEGFWAIGTTIYSVIYARMGTDIIAAMNISNTIFNLLFVFAISIGSALAIMIGNSIGSDEIDKAKSYAHKGLISSVVCGVGISIIMLVAKAPIISLYNISEAVMRNANIVTTITVVVFPITCLQFTLFIGILRAGGDTLFCTLVDILSLWFLGLPLVIIGAFVFKLSLPYVYMLAMSEHIIRTIICYYRYRSLKWINNVTA